MAHRPYWKGYLKLSLVTCPVSMSPATSESEKVRFHTLNRETGNRVVSQYVDAVALDTVKTIDIEKFVPRDSIEWIYLEKPHYLVPDDPVGHEAFAVIRDAMAADKVYGVSRLVIGRRERAVVLEPRGDGIVVWTLRFGDEVRPEESYFEDIDDRSDPDLVPLVQKFIKQHTKEWSPDMVSDPVQDALLDIIAKKKKALRPSKKGKTKGDERPSGGKVINIMDALRKSLAAGEKRKRAS